MLVDRSAARPRPGLDPAVGSLWTASAVVNLGDGVTRLVAPRLAATCVERPGLIAGFVCSALSCSLLHAGTCGQPISSF